jgi:IS30 family transposase
MAIDGGISRISYRQRPAAVEDRAVPGHWEGDLLSGPNNSYIAMVLARIVGSMSKFKQIIPKFQ